MLTDSSGFGVIIEGKIDVQQSSIVVKKGITSTESGAINVGSIICGDDSDPNMYYQITDHCVSIGDVSGNMNSEEGVLSVISIGNVTASNGIAIEVENITADYAGVVVLNNVSVEYGPGIEATNVNVNFNYGYNAIHVNDSIKS